MSKLRVAVLMGGTSSEREISLSTGRQIMAALDSSKYSLTALDAAALSGRPSAVLPDTVALAIPPYVAGESAAAEQGLVRVSVGDMAAGAAGGPPDVVFIALHGKGGEDGSVQGMLELLGIPYTGSGILASALAMNKTMAKRVLKAEGVRVPDEIMLHRRQSATPVEVDRLIARSFGYPAIIKPNSQGSTIGCTIVSRAEDLPGALGAAFACDESVLIEQLLKGVEITAGALGNEVPEVLPLIEIDASGKFYDYEAKYAPGGSSHIIPARISEVAARKAREYAARCHTTLGCRGMSRTDMIVVGDQPFVLEVNTIPGMTSTSLLPDAARAAGISFPELLDRIIASALED